MAKAKVANYEVFSDRTITLKRGADVDHTFESYIDCTPVAGEGAILMWNSYAQDNSDLIYSIYVNDTEVKRVNTGKHSLHSIQEVIGTGVLKPKAINKVKFLLESGTGRLNIQDVIIFYRDQIEASS